MTVFHKKWLFGCVVALACLAFGGANARAGFTLTLFDGTNTTTITDGQVGVDLNPLTGGITLAGYSFHNFLITTETGVSNSPGTHLFGQITTDSFLVTNLGSGTGTLTITFSDDTFTNPAGSGDLVEVRTSLQQDLIASDAKLTFFGKLDGVSTTPIQALTPGASASGSEYLVRGGPTYTLESILSIELAAGKSAGGETSVVATVPGPGGALLALSGLPVLFGWGLLRRKPKQA